MRTDIQSYLRHSIYINSLSRGSAPLHALPNIRRPYGALQVNSYIIALIFLFFNFLIL